jgi:hypothetical protein
MTSAAARHGVETNTLLRSSGDSVPTAFGIKPCVRLSTFSYLHPDRAIPKAPSVDTSRGFPAIILALPVKAWPSPSRRQVIPLPDDICARPFSSAPDFRFDRRDRLRSRALQLRDTHTSCRWSMFIQNTSHAVMAQRTESQDSRDDFPTPPWASGLIEHVLEDSASPSLTCLEPACGAGHVARVLKEYLGEVDASDAFVYGCGEVRNYLTHPYETNAFDWVISPIRRSSWPRNLFCGL